MKETIEKEIENKIFNKNDIRNIWNIISKEYSVLIDNHSSIKLTLNCFDGTKYESDSNSLLDDGEMIDLKKVKKININYYDYNLKRGIDFNISQGNYAGNITIYGEDKNWVAGIFSSIETNLNAIKPQECWFIENKNIILNIGAIAMGYIFSNLIEVLFFNEVKPLENPSQAILVIRNFFGKFPSIFLIFKIFSYWLSGFFLSYPIKNYIERLWPSIEFDFGPEHQKVEKNRRMKLWLILTLIIIPLIISLIF